MKLFIQAFAILLFLLSSCYYYGVNEEITIIGNLNTECVEKNAWIELENIYTTDSISSPEFVEGMDEIQNHFLHPAHILYFPEGPEEIVGCDYYSVRIAFNPKLSPYVFSGMDSRITNKELVRIRNRVQALLMKYQCKEGQKESEEWMKRPGR